MKRNVGELVSGKIGNVVFVTNGKNCYVRSAPQRKPDSWTDQQIYYRFRISKISELWRTLKSPKFVEIWNQAAEDINCYAWFIKKNIKAFSIDGAVIDYVSLLVSDGSLIHMQNLTASLDPGTLYSVNLEWSNDEHLKKNRLNDKIWIMSCIDGVFSEITDTGLIRKDLQGSIQLPMSAPWLSEVVFIYVFASSENNLQFTPSQCFKFSLN